MNGKEWKVKILENIKSAACDGCLLFYDELLALLGDDKTDERRRELYGILGELNRENEDGLNLSALVVDRNTGMPGPGFFREFMSKSEEGNTFLFFAGEVRKIFARHRRASTAVHYGVLIDADQVNAAKVRDFFLQKERGNYPIVCRACGIKGKKEWNMEPLERLCADRCKPDYYSVPAPTKQRDVGQRRQRRGANQKRPNKQSDAADFFLSMIGAVMMEKTYARCLLDKMYIISGDRDFAYLQKFMRSYGIDVQCVDNQLQEVECAGKIKI